MRSTDRTTSIPHPRSQSGSVLVPRRKHRAGTHRAVLSLSQESFRHGGSDARVVEQGDYPGHASKSRVTECAGAHVSTPLGRSRKAGAVQPLPHRPKARVWRKAHSLIIRKAES